MKWRKYAALSAVLCLLVSLLAGCGASADQQMAAAEEAPMMDQMAENELADAGDSRSGALPENRKWVVTVNMEAETEDLDALLDTVFSRVDSLGGYVEDQNIYNGNLRDTYRYRNASLTVRVPADRIDAFTDSMEQQSNVVSNSRNLEDITLQYVDTESRLKALEIEEARLLELLEQAQTMSDLLEIEGRLTDVRYEKERVTSQLRTYDNQVNYATVYLNIREVREYTPVEEPTAWERISTGFVRSLKGVGRGFVDFGIWLIVVSPYLLVWAVLIAAAAVIVRRIHRKRKQKKQGIPPETKEKSREDPGKKS